MAVVFAKESGDWSPTNTTIWGIWNDQTQQVEDYGQNPTADDDVFCNGYALTLKMSATVKTLSNRKKYDYLNNDGGRIAYNAGYTLSANEIDFVQLSQTIGCFGFGVNSAGVNCYIICPTIKIEGGYFCSHTYGNNAGWIITGNIYLKNSCLTDSGAGGTSTHLLTINGNVIGEGINYFVKSFTSAPNAGWTIVINGNCKLVGNDSVNNLGRLRLTVTGCYRNLDNNRFTLAQTSTSSVALGAIEYYSTNNTFGMASFSQFSMVNPSGFYWHDITEPRSNPYIIVSNYDLQNTQQYPSVTDVRRDVEYAWGALVGTMESGVQVGCVTKEDVREGVALIGMGEVGTLVVPSVDDVREGVVFDNGSVGTLIVEGGGDRLRIADFGYYTNAQSDTYIVDLTEQDKPKFAVAEERVLIEMFPDLDLGNIPDKYFDDLFVKYLKYRLIVEYYRTAGINSTFTPSEPTTEIVNYQNVRNEVWLNSANIYLKAWAKKYPESIMKPQRILL
ncbi:MAG: hypothetical protein II663_01445 [Bacteroidales bacterium]|nr:hypothetical protein [Bacteroidales bacterium]